MLQAIPTATRGVSSNFFYAIQLPLHVQERHVEINSMRAGLIQQLVRPTPMDAMLPPQFQSTNPTLVSIFRTTDSYCTLYVS